MKARPSTLLILALGVAAAVAASEVEAQAADGSAAVAAHESGSDFHADFEIDPTAYILDGYSVHVGLGYRAFRFDLGAFAADVPQLFHGNEGFESYANGFGLKAQWFVLGDRQRGPFVGLEGNLGKSFVRREDSDAAVLKRRASAGVQVGYRIPLPADFYVTPWIGVDYEFLADDVELEGATFEEKRVTFFPAIHVGYAFQ
jgi:hypothetical protein